MNQDSIIGLLFPQHWQAQAQRSDYFTGLAQLGGHTVRVVGTANKAEVGADLALEMAKAVLDTVTQSQQSEYKQAIVFLLDTQGQRLRRRDELLGLNGYMAHLAKAVEIARQHGHVVLSVVYGEAVSGGYISTGMMADACFALDTAEIKVMNLPAMSRITKIPLEQLQALAEKSPVFSPGVANYLKMGHLQAVWSAASARENLQAALEALTDTHWTTRDIDPRVALGAERQGRTQAQLVFARILSA